MKDSGGIKGHYTGILTHPDGTQEVFEKDNIILSIGYDFIRHRLFDDRITYFTGIALGTGGSVPVSADQYGVQKFLVYKGATATFDADDVHKIKMVAVFQQGEGTGTLDEAGVCTGISTGRDLYYNAAEEAVTVGNAVPKQTIENGVQKSNASSFEGNIFLDRVTFPAVEKAADDAYTCVFRFTLGGLAAGA